MYCPKFNEVAELGGLRALIDARGFGHWSAISKDDEIVINSMPFLMVEGEGDSLCLVGHVARANTIWQSCDTGKSSVVVFEGGDEYISPNYYPSKAEHGKVVPTWNYRIVQVRGKPQFIQDIEWLKCHVAELTAKHEGQQQNPWSTSDAPEAFIDKLLAAIVGVVIPVDDIKGKWKLGQNRPYTDQLGVIEALKTKGSDASIELAEIQSQLLNLQDGKKG